MKNLKIGALAFTFLTLGFYSCEVENAEEIDENSSLEFAEFVATYDLEDISALKINNDLYEISDDLTDIEIKEISSAIDRNSNAPLFLMDQDAVIYSDDITKMTMSEVANLEFNNPFKSVDVDNGRASSGLNRLSFVVEQMRGTRIIGRQRGIRNFTNGSNFVRGARSRIRGAANNRAFEISFGVFPIGNNTQALSNLSEFRFEVFDRGNFTRRIFSDDIPNFGAIPEEGFEPGTIIINDVPNNRASSWVLSSR